MKYATWPRIGSEVMARVRRVVTECLIEHDTEAEIEITVRMRRVASGCPRAIDLALELDEDQDQDQDLDEDQVKADQEARFRGLEL